MIIAWITESARWVRVCSE